MSDSNQIKETGISVNPDDAGKTETEKPKSDGGVQSDEKANKKGTVGGGAPRINEEVKSVLLFTATSIVAGYISFLLTPAKPAFIPAVSLMVALVTMAAIFAATSKIAQKLAGRKDMQWIMGNGGAIYLFLWFVSWIIFYNAM